MTKHSQPPEGRERIPQIAYNLAKLWNVRTGWQKI